MQEWEFLDLGRLWQILLLAGMIFRAFGAFFSAMEVIPLLLLTFDAWRFMRMGAPASARDRSVLHASATDFPHKWAVMFLVAS